MENLNGVYLLGETIFLVGHLRDNLYDICYENLTLIEHNENEVLDLIKNAEKIGVLE